MKLAAFPWRAWLAGLDLVRLHQRDAEVAIDPRVRVYHLREAARACRALLSIETEHERSR